MRTLSRSDDGGSIELSVGETLDVRLPENATTGYRWTVGQCDGDVLRLDESSASYPSAEAGSAGVAQFAFRAMQPGVTELVLEERRSWEVGRPAARSFTVRVLVRR